MTIHKITSAPPRKSTARSCPTQTGQAWFRFKYVLEARNEEPKRDWKDGKLAGAIVFCVVFALVWTLAGYVWTKAVTDPSVLVD